MNNKILILERRSFYVHWEKSGSAVRFKLRIVLQRSSDSTVESFPLTTIKSKIAQIPLHFHKRITARLTASPSCECDSNNFNVPLFRICLIKAEIKFALKRSKNFCAEKINSIHCFASPRRLTRTKLCWIFPYSFRFWSRLLVTIKYEIYFFLIKFNRHKKAFPRKYEINLNLINITRQSRRVFNLGREAMHSWRAVRSTRTQKKSSQMSFTWNFIFIFK